MILESSLRLGCSSGRAVETSNGLSHAASRPSSSPLDMIGTCRPHKPCKTVRVSYPVIGSGRIFGSAQVRRQGSTLCPNVEPPLTNLLPM